MSLLYCAGCALQDFFVNFQVCYLEDNESRMQDQLIRKKDSFQGQMQMILHVQEQTIKKFEKIMAYNFI